MTNSSNPTIEEIVNHIKALRPSAGSTVVVGIDGCGGAGKSTLARSLAEHLGAAVIQTDDFASWDNPIDWWPRLLQQALQPLSRREPAHYQRWDWEKACLAEWRTVMCPIILIEGVTATRKEFRPYLAFSIYVECPRDLRLKRGLERDGEQALPLWLDWMAHEDRYCELHNPQGHADLIVEGT